MLTWSLRIICAIIVMTLALPLLMLAQTADYGKLLAQARAYLTAGQSAAALACSQKAIQIDASRWEAYLVAGLALRKSEPVRSCH